MASSLNTTDPAGRKPPSFGIRQFLFIVFLAVIFFLLGQSMVRHRFFQGGAAPAETRTPNLHRANKSLTKSADGRVATVATRWGKRKNTRTRPSHGRQLRS